MLNLMFMTLCTFFFSLINWFAYTRGEPHQFPFYLEILAKFGPEKGFAIVSPKTGIHDKWK